VQDIEEAKSLLKKAGREGFSVVLPTSEAEPGFNEACTIFAEQAKAAGVKITVQQTTPASRRRRATTSTTTASSTAGSARASGLINPATRRGALST
jgi:ABC-type transport system substrate-binding protein